MIAPTRDAKFQVHLVAELFFALCACVGEYNKAATCELLFGKVSEFIQSRREIRVALSPA